MNRSLTPKIVILDRDGVINFDSDDYIKSVDEWRPIPHSAEAISLLYNHGYNVYVATNQAGIARGLFDLNTLNAIHARLNNLVESAGGKIEAIYYCPHHPDEHCQCRKPGTGLLSQIEDHSGQSLVGQPFVGDSLTDIQAALAMGCRPILVKTGNGAKTFHMLEPPVETYDDLFDFATSII